MPAIAKEHKPHYLNKNKIILKGETFTPVIIGDDSGIKCFCDICDFEGTDHCGIIDCFTLESDHTINTVFQKN